MREEVPHLRECAGILVCAVQSRTTRCQGGTGGKLVRSSTTRWPQMTAHTLNMYEPTIEVGEGDQVEEEIDNQAWDSSPVAEEIRCSDEYRPLITKIVSENRDVFAMQSLARQTL